jgi:cell division protease FtsH
MKKPSMPAFTKNIAPLLRHPLTLVALLSVAVMVVLFNSGEKPPVPVRLDANGGFVLTVPETTPTTRAEATRATNPTAATSAAPEDVAYQFGSRDPIADRQSEPIGTKGSAGLVGGTIAMREQMDALVGLSTLVSLSGLQDAAASGRYGVAWLDDTHHAVLLSPRSENDKPLGEPLVAYYPKEYTTELTGALGAAGVDVRVGPSFTIAPSPGGVNTWLFLLLIIVALVIGNQLAKNRWKKAGENATPDPNAEGAVPTTRFTDVAGVDEAVEDMRELVTFLQEPERFEKAGARAPRGALLSGPPGTGKTLLARAVAGEAGVPFYAVSGSDFVEMFVGVGAKRVRELFAKARKADKAIVFIDEIDAVARRRGADANGAQQETENTLIALLNEMDGFNGTHVIVLAATNRVDILDPAITRPGRLDLKINVPAPDRRGRERIFAVHSAGKPIDDDVDFVVLARRTPGMSGAEISQVVNEACLEAARRELAKANAACFDAALATVSMGRARTSALVTDHDRLITAWHEAGHTVCALLQADADDPVSVSIVPRGHAGGVTWMSGSDDQYLAKNRADARLVTALGGRAAEEMLLDGSYTQGAHGDLTAATNLAMAMATQYGMTRLGLMVRDGNVLAASGMEGVNEVVEELLSGALVEARKLLRRNRRFVEALVIELLEEETLNHAEIIAVYEKTTGKRLTRPNPEPGERDDREPMKVAAKPTAPARANTPKRKPSTRVKAPVAAAKRAVRERVAPKKRRPRSA